MSTPFRTPLGSLVISTGQCPFLAFLIWKMTDSSCARGCLGCEVWARPSKDSHGCEVGACLEVKRKGLQLETLVECASYAHDACDVLTVDSHAALNDFVLACVDNVYLLLPKPPRGLVRRESKPCTRYFGVYSSNCAASSHGTARSVGN